MIRCLVVVGMTVMSTMASDYERRPVKIETERGTVEWKQSSGKETISTIVRELTPEELKKLDADADKAKNFINRYVPEKELEDDLLENLDLAFAAWLKSPDPKKETEKEVIEVIGAAYGRYCIQKLGLRWALTEDKYGREIALVLEKPVARGNPFSSIQYRIEDKKTDFIYSLYATLKYLINSAEK